MSLGAATTQNWTNDPKFTNDETVTALKSHQSPMQFVCLMNLCLKKMRKMSYQYLKKNLNDNTAGQTMDFVCHNLDCSCSYCHGQRDTLAVHRWLLQSRNLIQYQYLKLKCSQRWHMLGTQNSRRLVVVVCLLQQIKNTNYPVFKINKHYKSVLHVPHIFLCVCLWIKKTEENKSVLKAPEVNFKWDPHFQKKKKKNQMYYMSKSAHWVMVDSSVTVSQRPQQMMTHRWIWQIFILFIMC